MVLKASVPLTTTPITDNLLNSSAAECTVFAATIAISSKKKLTKHYKHLFTFGFSLLLLSIVLLLLRYYIYGFKGINELIKIKEQELQELGAECTVFAATIAISSAFLPLVASLTTVAVPTIVLSVFSMA
jgi:hypothetical protein